ncbi:MAG: hypothetical protein ACXW06_07490 [Halobacteriota archaeon]
MNATEETLRQYLEALHGTVREVSARFLSPDHAKEVLHNSLLPAQITCYLSTQFGVAFEYTPAPLTTIEVFRGSARVEDLLVQAPCRLRGVGPTFNINGSNCGIAHITLEGTFPFRLGNKNADVTLQEIRFSSKPLDWQRDVDYAEVYGDRRAVRWSVESAQSRAKDEVLAALFLAKQAEKADAKLEDYIQAFRKQSVLVLGAYDTAGMERLLALSSGLADLGYKPVLVADVPDFEHYDLAQKVVAIGSLSRFIVIDDSAPSGHLNEVELCRMNRWVTVLLRAHGHAASSMTLGASIASTMIHELEYAPIHELEYAPDSPQSALQRATTWAEDRLVELEKQLRDIYPYRKTS